jgi:hypothetical protein
VDETADPVAQREWQEHLARVAAEQEPGWEASNAPGSFGCHELLDRVNLLGDVVEGQILGHPACALRPEWYHLAARATEALRDLYQLVGAEHLSVEDVAEQGTASDPNGRSLSEHS